MRYFTRETKALWIPSVHLLFPARKVLRLCGMFNSFECRTVTDVISFKSINTKCSCKTSANTSKTYVRDLSKNVQFFTLSTEQTSVTSIPLYVPQKEESCACDSFRKYNSNLMNRFELGLSWKLSTLLCDQCPSVLLWWKLLSFLSQHSRLSQKCFPLEGINYLISKIPPVTLKFRKHHFVWNQTAVYNPEDLTIFA